MSENATKPAAPVGLETHAGVIHQSRFCDRGVSASVSQLDSHWRRRPLTLFYVTDFFPAVNSFIVAVKIMEPGGAVFGKYKRGGFIRNSHVAVARNDVTERDPVIEHADVDRKVGTRRAMSRMDATSVVVIHRHGMHSAPRVFFTHAIGFDLANLRVATEVDTINDDPNFRSLDHRIVFEGDPVVEVCRCLAIEKEFYLGVRTGGRRFTSSARTGERDTRKRNRRDRRRRQKVAARIEGSFFPICSHPLFTLRPLGEKIFHAELAKDAESHFISNRP